VREEKKLSWKPHEKFP
jgi:hypothetical protein